MPERRIIPGWLSIGWGWLLLVSVGESLLWAFVPQVFAKHYRMEYLDWFLDAWGLLQAGWLWRADHRCKAIFWYVATFLLSLVNAIFRWNLNWWHLRMDEGWIGLPLSSSGSLRSFASGPTCDGFFARQKTPTFN
jgi:hypothetical protein